MGADGASNMALLEVKMVTGWTPVVKTLENARKTRVRNNEGEWEAGGRTVEEK